MPKFGLTSIKRNTLINLAGSVVPILVSLITVPLYLRHIGEARYGVLAILWTLLGYFGVFDMGLGRATVNQIAGLRDDPQGSASLFWTALISNTILGGLGAGLLLLSGNFLLRTAFEMPATLRLEAVSALPWLAIAVPLITLTAVLNGSLEGHERFLTVNIVDILGNLLLQILPLSMALWYGPSLQYLVFAVVLARFTTTSILFRSCIRGFSLGQWPRFERRWIRGLFSYGSWITISGLVGPLLTSLDRYIIGTVSGVRAVAQYSIPYYLVSHMTMLPGSLSRTLFPRFSQLKGDVAQSIREEAAIALVGFLTPLVIVGLLLLRPFLEVWVGPEMAQVGGPVGELLLLGFWINSMAIIPYSFLQGQGRPDLTAKFHVIEFVPYMVMLWAGLKIAGLPGAALAWSFRAALDAAFLNWAANMRWKELSAILPMLGLVSISTIGALFVLQPVYRVLLQIGLLIVALIWAWLNVKHIRILISEIRLGTKRILVSSAKGLLR